MRIGRAAPDRVHVPLQERAARVPLRLSKILDRRGADGAGVHSIEWEMRRGHVTATTATVRTISTWTARGIRAKHGGTSPETLEALVPRYVTRLPSQGRIGNDLWKFSYSREATCACVDWSAHAFGRRRECVGGPGGSCEK